ncbi:NADP-dependent oxidoreductase [Actinomycetospora termitidis]|uniref:NADP-dependent oxidoreductase n=1 Tax=Actinomycetospora termitidis TaxID=3053470 RepID=A0ABT7MIQ8_9PSEU|nr:NADP-dependent oxidoreductase [Actinomycetospora sp. Odt1-22]MDL5160516.1 NADP-dependent oxidoreductase [Actinomycetospora sp. Odt1-22]
MSSDRMKAVRIHGFGDESVLAVESAPIPELGPGDVLVRVHAAAVNPVDSLVRQGIFAVSQRPLPWIPGWDFAGTIAAVGTETTAWAAGDVVYGRPSLARDGSYAQYLAVDAGEIAAIPRSLSLESAAAVPLVTLTAWKALFDLGGLEPGGTVLVHAGAGGVGTMAVQLAHHRGAKVVATASGDGIALARSLGADEVIDYRSEDFTVRGRFADVVLDTVGGETLERSYGVVAPSGTLITIAGAPDEAKATELGIEAHTFVLDSNGPRLAEIAGMIDAGDLRPVVTRVLDLDEVAQAHRLIDSGHTHGKVVLRVG